MKGMAKIPALEDAIAALIDALAKGNARTAEALISDSAREAFTELSDAAFGAGPAQSIERLGFARIGFHYMMKLRFVAGGAKITWLLRWREEDGRWRLASIEDLSGKRSPWSDVPTLANARRETTNNG
jgi:hypothetical protein